ncbi:hypothetical protein HYV30_04235 [Candidatus Kaiserbacteria bacterium]|nr:hypothetical protein [Candidatus Kaiserbacteria bacterium]
MSPPEVRIFSAPSGACVPIPTLPFASTVTSVLVEVPAVVDAIVKSGVSTAVDAEFEIDRRE